MPGFDIPVKGLPVVDAATGIYYINENCARCNDVKKFNEIQLELSCTNNLVLSIVRSVIQSMLSTTNNSNTFELISNIILKYNIFNGNNKECKINHVYNMTFLRPCYPNVISTCSYDNQGTYLEKAM